MTAPLRLPAGLDPLARFDAAAQTMTVQIAIARDRYRQLFPALSEDDRAEAADAMPDLMNRILGAMDEFIAAVCLDADGWIGGVFGQYERRALLSVATAGWETESYDSSFAAAAERLRAEARQPQDEEID